MAHTLRQRLNANDTVAEVYTLHSYGLHLLQEHLPHLNISVSPHKLYHTVCTLLGRTPDPKEWRQIAREVNQMRHEGIKITENVERPMTLPVAILWAMKENNGVIDQEEQIYRCLCDRLPPVTKYDLVLVDEAQDLNRSSIEFLKCCVLSENTVLCVVGDDHQAIYAFRGAMANSIEEIKMSFRPNCVFLSTCFRCPQRIAHLASYLNPLLRRCDHESLGNIILHRGPVTPVDFESAIDQRGPLVVLNRTNASVLSILRQLYTWTGRTDWSKVTRWMSPLVLVQLDAVQEKLGEMTLSEAHQTLMNGVEEMGPVDNVIVQVIQVAIEIEGAHNVTVASSSWITFLLELLRYDRPESPHLLLCTVHACKGQEYNHVMVIDYNHFGMGVRHTPEEIQQEQNLLYIAITRSTEHLVLVQQEKNSSGRRSILLPEEIIRHSQTLQ